MGFGVKRFRMDNHVGDGWQDIETRMLCSDSCSTTQLLYTCPFWSVHYQLLLMPSIDMKCV